MKLIINIIRVIVENSWNMWLPGFPQEGGRGAGKSSSSSTGPASEAHKQRLSLIKKSKK